jgi:hypothetical protein
MALANPDAHKSVPIRQDLLNAIDRAWRHLSGPGTWWTGAQRLRMVAEARNAAQCPLCRRRKAALSPYTVPGVHSSLGELDEVVVDVIHRVSTDAGRLTQKWVQDCFEKGITDAEYVEIVGLVAMITALDTFAHAMGDPPRPLTQALPDEPTRRRPNGAKKSIGWVPTVAPQDLQPGDVDPYRRYGSVHIQQALSLVPNSVIGFFDLDIVLYLQQNAIRDFSTEYRAISHAQLEFPLPSVLPGQRGWAPQGPNKRKGEGQESQFPRPGHHSPQRGG